MNVDPVLKRLKRDRGARLPLWCWLRRVSLSLGVLAVVLAAVLVEIALLGHV